jgi:hypothetical protein
MGMYESYGYEIHRVTSFKLVGDYTAWVKFDDDTEQVIDFEPILSGPVFGPLRDLALFSQAALDKDFGTLVWPNGADIDPMVLYNWPQQVDAIVERRRQQSAVPS